MLGDVPACALSVTILDRGEHPHPSLLEREPLRAVDSSHMEKGAITKMAEETANEAVNQMRTPIEKARSVAKQQEENRREMADVVKDQ
jgi:hypothetical protein